MINPAVNKNINTANSRAAMAQDQNIISLINKTNRAIASRGGDIKSPAAKALVNRAIMIYEQGLGAKVVTADDGILTSTDGTTATTTAGEEESATSKTPEELAAEAKAAEEAAAKAEKERLKGMADASREGQRQLVVDVSSDPTAAITSPDVETIMNKTYDADGNLVSSTVPAGTTVADSAGKVATPLEIAGKKESTYPLS